MQNKCVSKFTLNRIFGILDSYTSLASMWFDCRFYHTVPVVLGYMPDNLVFIFPQRTKCFAAHTILVVAVATAPISIYKP